MIFGHVKDRRGSCAQAGGGFQLKAGKLKDIQLAAFVQQHQCGQTDITAHADVHACGFRHFAHQSGDGAFTIRTGNRNNGRLHFTAEQLDITDNLNPRISRSAE